MNIWVHGAGTAVFGFGVSTHAQTPSLLAFVTHLHALQLYVVIRLHVLMRGMSFVSRLNSSSRFDTFHILSFAS